MVKKRLGLSIEKDGGYSKANAEIFINMGILGYIDVKHMRINIIIKYAFYI